MKQTLFDLYKIWFENGETSGNGLCNSIFGEYKQLLELFKPETDEYSELLEKELATTYWGSGLSQIDDDRIFKFTDLRQTIVLFICAMSDELI